MKSRLLQAVEKDIIQDVDGFYYYFPRDFNCLPSHHLREIANELDRLNKPWEDEIAKYHTHLEDENV